jgi:transcriptional antiterminator NusG
MLLDSETGWFALHVRVRTEQQVSLALRSKGYEEFLPTLKANNNGSAACVPLFPGYLFCRLRSNVRGPVVTTPGVISVVGFGGRPAPIDPDEMRSIQVVANSGAVLRTWHGLCEGDKVRIEEGPLRGAVGVMVWNENKEHMLVSVTILTRTVVVELQRDWIRAIRPLPIKLAEPLTAR